MTYQLISAMSEIADRYDAYIIDLWGVLHDGMQPYPGAKEALEALRQQNKEVILLSNAPRRAVKAEQRLNELGFGTELYDYVVTSGELTYRYLTEEYKQALSQVLNATTGQAEGKYGLNYFYIGPEKDLDLLHGGGFNRVETAMEADFALVTGFDAFGDEMETKLPFMQEALAAKLTLYCANPDMKVVNQQGQTMLCAGRLGEWYQQQDGKVEFFGKPHSGAYRACMELLHVTDSARMVAVGDSLHTDVAGARGAGIDSVFCAAGIHLDEVVMGAWGDNPSAERLEALFNEYRITPTYVMPSFSI